MNVINNIMNTKLILYCHECYKDIIMSTREGYGYLRNAGCQMPADKQRLSYQVDLNVLYMPYLAS